MKTGEILADKYRVDHVLGVGGMGVVVAATHVELDQRVALKFLQPHAAVDSGLVERFVREGRAAVRLKSEHVARVLDVGRMADGNPYIVMEFLEGNNLGTIVKERGPIPVEEAVGYVLQACDAVAEAHGAKIVHRDLKPENLFVTTRNDGRPLVKVLDFGISKALDSKSQSLTQTDSMMGSPAYMAPEQMRSSKDVDERADIWSLGAILYELTTGKLPYIAESLASLAFMLVEGPPPSPRSHNPNLPEELDAVIMRCLERDRNARIPHIGALAKALAPFAAEGDETLVTRINTIASSQQRSAYASLPEIVQADTVLQPSSPPVTPSNAPLKQTGGWQKTHNEAPSPIAKRSSRGAYIGGAVAIAALGAIGFYVQRSSHHDSVGMKSEPPPAAASVAPPLTTPPKTEPAATTEPSPPTPVSATPSAPTTNAPVKNPNVRPKNEPAPPKPSASSAPAPKPSGGNGFIHERE